MGTRPSSFQGGGGYFSGAAKIVRYRFTDDELTPDGPKPFEPGTFIGKDGKEKEKNRRLSAELWILQDGASEARSQFVGVGKADFYRISPDGLTLTSSTDGRKCSPQKESDLALLISEMVKSGFPEELLDSDDTRVNLEALLNHRFQFVQARLTDKQVRDRKLNIKGREDKKNRGTFYPHTRASVDEYLGRGEDEPVKTQNRAIATPVKNANEIDHETAAQILADLVRDSGGSIRKNRISVPLMTHPAVKGKTVRDDYVKYMANDENLSNLAHKIGGIYNKTTQTVTLQ